MSLKENRKKVQKSIVFIGSEYPAKLAVPELRLILQTVQAELRILGCASTTEAALTETSEDAITASSARCSAIDTVGKYPLRYPLGID
jgi:hypothetical protein